MHMQVLVRIRVPCHQTAVFATEEGYVNHGNNRSGIVYFFRNLNGVEKFCHGTRAPVDVGAKQFLCALAEDKLIPQSLRLSLGAPDTR